MYCVLKEHTWDVKKQITECAIYMAEWKDEQHAKEKQQWIEKACEWLKDNANDSYLDWYDWEKCRLNKDELLHDFREAMKGE